MQFRVTTLRYRPKEAVPIEPNQQRHISTDGVKTTAGATGQPGAPAPKNKKKPKKRRSIIGMIFSFIGCMLCLCIMAGSVGGMLLFQTFMNIFMNVGLLPVMGLTLPFFSYGGTSIVTMFAALGIAAGVRMREKPSWLQN